MSVKDGKWAPWICWEKGHGLSDCDGHMELKNVEVKGGEVTHQSDEGQTFHDVTPPYLTKTWVCDGCGVVFIE